MLCVWYINCVLTRIFPETVKNAWWFCYDAKIKSIFVLCERKSRRKSMKIVSMGQNLRKSKLLTSVAVKEQIAMILVIRKHFFSFYVLQHIYDKLIIKTLR